MKINKSIVLVLVLIALLAFTAISQISQVTSTISVEENKQCATTFYNQTESVYGYVTRTRETYGSCLRNSTYIFINNVTQVNETRIRYFYERCVNGTESYQSYEVTGNRIVLRNTTNCSPKSYIVSVIKGSVTEKREVDFSNWGVCVQSTENNCVAITCGSQHGGSAVNGIFNGCDGGKSCQKFLFCQDEIKVLYKASRDDFVNEDPTFHLSPLAYREVTK